MSNWFDFSVVEDVNLIPANTIAKVRMEIKMGGYNDLEKGWSGGYVTKGTQSGSCYLDCVYTILTPPYDDRKVFSKIGLHSEKGPKWEQMGKKFIKDALSSHYGLKKSDKSDEAVAKQIIKGFHDLDGLIFVVLINQSENQETGDMQNEIRTPVTAEHPQYSTIMNGKTSSVPW